MENLFNLIEQLSRTVPFLNAEPLCLFPPDSVKPEIVCAWLKEHLEEQELIAYHHKTDIIDSLPYIKTLENLALEEAFNIDFILELYESLDWSTSMADLPYDLPFVHYLNYLLLPHDLRLLVIPHTDYWHILCVHNNEAEIQTLHRLCAHFEIPLISYPAMGIYDCMDYIEDLTRV